MMLKIRLLCLLLAGGCILYANFPSTDWGLERLEEILAFRRYKDLIDDTVPGYSSAPSRADVLEEFSNFLSVGGWSTNMLIKALFYEMTNGYERGWGELTDRERRIVGAAAGRLCRLDHPMVTNFFVSCNANPAMWCKSATYSGMLINTKLEPEVLDYMRTLWVQTNVYDYVAWDVYRGMKGALVSLDDALKPSATNRVAKYIYGTLRQLTRHPLSHDGELAGLVPAYSNSVQRLAAMRYIADTTTNAYIRTKATSLVEELSAVPAAELNNLTWLEDE